MTCDYCDFWDIKHYRYISPIIYLKIKCAILLNVRCSLGHRQLKNDLNIKNTSYIKLIYTSNQ